MTFILTPARMDGLFAAFAYKFEAAEILKDRGAAATEHFDTLFRESPVAIREITDCPFGTVAKTKRDQHVVATVSSRITDCPRLDFYDWRAGKEHQQIDEVADFAENAATALLAIVHPVVGRKMSCVNPIMQRQRLGDRSEERLHPRRHRSEPSIEADHQHGPLGEGDSEIGVDDRA